jgi:hypothetical protein
MPALNEVPEVAHLLAAVLTAEHMTWALTQVCWRRGTPYL